MLLHDRQQRPLSSLAVTLFFFFSSRRRHTRFDCDWSSDVCSSDLFSGDLYLAPRLRYLRADEDVYAMMDSLRRVLALEPRVLFCQHRGRVEQGAARLRDKLDFLVELGERIHELHGRGWSDAAIARALPGSDLLWRVWTGGDFSKRNFVRAFLRTANAR